MGSSLGKICLYYSHIKSRKFRCFYVFPALIHCSIFFLHPAFFLIRCLVQQHYNQCRNSHCNGNPAEQTADSPVILLLSLISFIPITHDIGNNGHNGRNAQCCSQIVQQFHTFPPVYMLFLIPLRLSSTPGSLSR